MKTFKPILPLAALFSIFTFNTSKAVDSGNNLTHAKQSQLIFPVMKNFSMKHLRRLTTGKLTVLKATNQKLHASSNDENYSWVYLQEPSYQYEQYSVNIYNGDHDYIFDTSEFTRSSDGSYNFGSIAPGVYTIDIYVEGDDGWFGADITFNDSNNNTVDEDIDDLSMPSNDILYYNQDIGNVIGNVLNISIWKDSGE